MEVASKESRAKNQLLLTNVINPYIGCRVNCEASWHSVQGEWDGGLDFFWNCPKLLEVCIAPLMSVELSGNWQAKPSPETSWSPALCPLMRSSRKCLPHVGTLSPVESRDSSLCDMFLHEQLCMEVWWFLLSLSQEKDGCQTVKEHWTGMSLIFNMKRLLR